MVVPARAFDHRCDPRVVLDNLADLVFVLDTAGTVLDVNETCLRLLRWNRDDAVGQSVFDIVHPDDVAVAISSLGTLQDKETGTPIELRVSDVDGVWHWMEIIGSNGLLDGGISGLVCVARDITQRRMWEVAGGDVARFQQVLHHAPSITMLLDGGGVITSVNHAFTRLLGHDPSLVVGAALATFVDESSLPLLSEALQTVRGAERRSSVELAMRTTSRQTRLIRFDLVDQLDDPVVGGIIGSGIFLSPAVVASRLGTSALTLSAWGLGAVIALIGAFVLWYLTVGAVRGFAFFLGLSTMLDLFVSYFFTRPTVLLLARTKWMERRKVMGIAVSAAAVTQ